MAIQQKYTVSEATKFLGFKSRSTINKRTQGAGLDSISFEMDDEGNKVIPLAELERAFPDKYREAVRRHSNTTDTEYTHSAKAHSDTAKNTPDTKPAHAHIALLQAQLDYEREERARERQEMQERERKAEAREESARAMIERLTDTIGKQTLLLSHIKEEAEKRQEEPPKNAPKGFWAALLGKRD